MSSLTMFETSQLIAQQLEFSSVGYMELMENQNDLLSTLNCNFKTFNNTHTFHNVPYKPTSYKNPLMAKQCIIKQISFMIASYITAPNSAFQNKLIKSLSDSKLIDSLSVPTSIIQTIVQRFLFGIKWNSHFIDKSLSSLHPNTNSIEADNESTDSSDSEQNDDFNPIHANRFRSYFEYDLNQSLIKYPFEIVDALHIATSFEINLSEYKDRNYQYIFHMNITKKGDESWIGLMNKASYKSLCEYQDKANDNVCVLYYGGRERCIDARLSINRDILKQLHDVHTEHGQEIELALMSYLNRDGHGAIYANGKCVVDKLRPFRTADWISVCIENDWITFYNNGQLVCRKDLRENQLCNQDLILFSLVDYDDDCIFIEQSHSKKGLMDNPSYYC